MLFIAPSTFHPNEAWVKEQAQAFLQHVEETGLETTIVMHDRDTKFTASFEEVLDSADLEVKKAAHRSPNTNAFVERFIQTLQQECLDYFIVFGEQHMDHIVSEMVTHYHEERPHQAKENDPLVLAAPEVKPTKAKRKKNGESPPDVVPISQVECRQRLGGFRPGRFCHDAFAVLGHASAARRRCHHEPLTLFICWKNWRRPSMSAGLSSRPFGSTACAIGTGRPRVEAPRRSLSAKLTGDAGPTLNSQTQFAL